MEKELQAPGIERADTCPSVEDNLTEEEKEKLRKEMRETGKGIKFNKGKLRFSLIPDGTLESYVKVLGYGAAKYSDNNWQKVSVTDYYDALCRHLNAWKKGEELDPETGEPHMSHIICCASFIRWHDLNKKP